MAKSRPKLAGQGKALFFNEATTAEPTDSLPKGGPDLLQKIEALKAMIAQFKQLAEPAEFKAKRCGDLLKAPSKSSQ